MRIAVVILFLATTLLALECSSDSTLRKYNLTKMIEVRVEKDTPPSRTTEEWYLNLCSTPERMPSECEEGDMICGIQWVKVPDRDSIVSRIIHIKSEKYVKSHSYPGQLSLELDPTQWGDQMLGTYVSFSCELDSEKDVVEFENWGSGLHMHISGPSGCVKKEYDRGMTNDRFYYYGDDRWSMSTWILICLVSFAILYFIFSCYLKRRHYTVRDLIDELIGYNEKLVQFVSTTLATKAATSTKSADDYTTQNS